MFPIKLARSLVLVSAAFGILWGAPARAEVDPGWNLITQNGKVVGEIYAERAYPSEIPTEHWVLYNSYVFPGPTRLVPTVIVPQAVSRYANTTDFLQKVKWGPGFLLMESKPTVSATIPGR